MMNKLNFEQKEEKFFELVEEAAKKLHKRFFIDSGEGRDLETDRLYCEDISGWLIDEDKVNEFLKSDRNHEKWDEFYVFEEWENNNGEIKIDFKKYPIYK